MQVSLFMVMSLILLFIQARMVVLDFPVDNITKRAIKGNLLKQVAFYMQFNFRKLEH
jgi:hypothetical protein